jgi:hypothetical protein
MPLSLSLSLSPRRVVVLMALVGGCTCIVMRHLVIWRRSLSDTNQAASRRYPGVSGIGGGVRTCGMTRVRDVMIHSSVRTYVRTYDAIM